MATFIALIDFTEQGVRTIAESPRRAEDLVQRARRMGITVKDVYWTLGRHDGVLIVEAPDDKTASALFLSLARAGNVRTHALRAYDRAELTEILARAD